MDPDFYYRRPAQLPPATQAERDLAWKCEVCGYHLLSMDQSGKGLPLEPGPSGQIVPLKCPRCKQEHPHWSPISPFDAFGDHANLPSALSSRVAEGKSLFEDVHQTLMHKHQQQIEEQQQQQQSTTTSGAVTPQINNNNNSIAATISRTGSRSQSRSGVPMIGNSPQQQSTNIRTSSLSPTPSLYQQRSPSSPNTLDVYQRQQATMLGGIGAKEEYEVLADHEALKDPDVVEALQRLRRRKGAYFHQQAEANQQQQGPGRFSRYYQNNIPSGQRGGGGGGYYSSVLDATSRANNNTANRDGLTEEQISRLPDSSLQRAAAHRVTGPKPLECYVCGLCQRRLLRIDHKGELIPIEADAQGNLTTIVCPGCHVDHSRWIRVKLNGTNSRSHYHSNQDDVGDDQHVTAL